MKKILFIFLLLSSLSMSSQVFTENLDRRDDAYFAVATNAAVDEKDNIILNGVLEAGVSHDFIDVSLRYEYVDIMYSYHSVCVNPQIIVWDSKLKGYNNGFMVMVGGKWGYIIRQGGHQYYGFDAEIRYDFKWWFISLEPSTDLRTDIGSIWGEAKYVNSLHFKAGVKF